MNNLDYILSAKSIREQTKKVYELCKNGKTHFKLNEDKLDDVSDFVIEVINKNYPDHKIPFHSRWGHFKVGGINRVERLDEKFDDKIELAKAKLDLAIVSVLLDAGAGMKWRYQEKSGKEFSKSEGLAIASFDMFMEGKFSSAHKIEADGNGLTQINAQAIKEGFQVNENNPLIGIDGRVSLLNKLGELVINNSSFKNNRPGDILDILTQKYGNQIKAEDVLKAVLFNFGSIWPGRIELDGVNLGDVWKYEPLNGELIPFHKLSSWLSYSLLEPLMDAGIDIIDLNSMTGLPEYRNGGLVIDKGLIELRNDEDKNISHLPDSELIIEWRSLTVQLLDQIAENVRKKLNKSQDEFPLVKVLEGGTWWAGRYAAKELREDGGPPLNLDSDGTVF